MAVGAAKYEIIIVANADQAEATLAKLSGALGATGDKAEGQTPKVVALSDRLAKTGPAGRLAASALDDVSASISGRLGPGSEAAALGLAQLDTKLGGMGRNALVAGAAVGATAVGIAAAYTVAAKGVETYVSKVNEVAKLRSVTRGSMEDTSKLSNLLGDLGVDTESAAKAFAVFGANVDKGKLAEYGIETVRAADGTVNLVATLEKARNAIASEEDATKRAAMARALFGRGYLELGRYLSTATDEFKRYQEAAAGDAIVSDDDLQRVREFERAQNDLADAMEKLWVHVGREVTPAATDFASGLEVLTQKATDAAGALNEGTGGGFGEFLKGLFPVLSGIAWLGSSANDAKPPVDALGGAVGRLGDESADAGENVKSLSDAVLDYADAQVGAERAALSLEEATKGWEEEQAKKAEERAQRVADARRDEAQAEQDLAQARVDAAQQVADAERAVADAQARASEQVASARQRVRDAERRLADERRRNASEARRVDDAQRDLARVQEDIAAGRLEGVDAVRAQQDAEETYNRAQQDAAEAERQRQERIAEAERQVKAARAAEHKAEVEGAASVKRAREELARARAAGERSIQQAVDRTREAHRKLTEAQDAEGLSARELRKHQLDVEAATIANSRAQRNLKTRTDDVNEAAALQGGTLEDVDAIMRELGLTTIPKLRTELRGLATDWKAALAAQGAYYAAPGSSYAPGGSTYDSQVPRQAGTPWAGPTGGGDVTFHVNVTGAIITDPKAAETLGRTVAGGVIKEMQSQQAQGRRIL